MEDKKRIMQLEYKLLEQHNKNKKNEVSREEAEEEVAKEAEEEEAERQETLGVLLKKYPQRRTTLFRKAAKQLPYVL